MRKITLLVFFVAITIFTCLQSNAASEINWQPWSNEVFVKAEKEHQLVMVYVKASWCPWCQKMDRTTLNDPNLVKLINTHYIPVRFDIDKDAAMVKELKVVKLPTAIIFNANHREIKRFSGYLTPVEMEEKLK